MHSTQAHKLGVPNTSRFARHKVTLPPVFPILRQYSLRLNSFGTFYRLFDLCASPHGQIVRSLRGFDPAIITTPVGRLRYTFSPF